ncbi:hypothetical protein D3C76_1541100 [compost metagenome]
MVHDFDRDPDRSALRLNPLRFFSLKMMGRQADRLAGVSRLLQQLTGGRRVMPVDPQRRVIGRLEAARRITGFARGPDHPGAVDHQVHRLPKGKRLLRSKPIAVPGDQATAPA